MKAKLLYLAVTGFAILYGMISDLTDPALSSVEQHGYKIGMEAVRLLIERIERKTDLPSQTILIKTQLVVKGSSHSLLR
jgi:LacI family transcriptional regulator